MPENIFKLFKKIPVGRNYLLYSFHGISHSQKIHDGNNRGKGAKTIQDGRQGAKSFQRKDKEFSLCWRLVWIGRTGETEMFVCLVFIIQDPREMKIYW